ncbi:hypothetical protein CVT26_001038 [Gymnopilus dilepis]|uniref:Uncharacterized protein n=1 Tax=Gymnopilus dilepis TaxID=231916 RepID=A0A409YN28_9AGAR|nr:hypothetical protein CVT26_001038 [Gymnopilus dilepis]
MSQQSEVELHGVEDDHQMREETLPEVDWEARRLRVTSTREESGFLTPFHPARLEYHRRMKHNVQESIYYMTNRLRAILLHRLTVSQKAGLVKPWNACFTMEVQYANALIGWGTVIGEALDVPYLLRSICVLGPVLDPNIELAMSADMLGLLKTELDTTKSTYLISVPLYLHDWWLTPPESPLPFPVNPNNIELCKRFHNAVTKIEPRLRHTVPRPFELRMMSAPPTRIPDDVGPSLRTYQSSKKIGNIPVARKTAQPLTSAIADDTKHPVIPDILDPSFIPSNKPVSEDRSPIKPSVDYALPEGATSPKACNSCALYKNQISHMLVAVKEAIRHVQAMSQFAGWRAAATQRHYQAYMTLAEAAESRGGEITLEDIIHLAGRMPEAGTGIPDPTIEVESRRAEDLDLSIGSDYDGRLPDGMQWEQYEEDHVLDPSGSQSNIPLAPSIQHLAGRHRSASPLPSVDMDVIHEAPTLQTHVFANMEKPSFTVLVDSWRTSLPAASETHVSAEPMPNSSREETFQQVQNPTISPRPPQAVESSHPKAPSSTSSSAAVAKRASAPPRPNLAPTKVQQGQTSSVPNLPPLHTGASSAHSRSSAPQSPHSARTVVSSTGLSDRDEGSESGTNESYSGDEDAMDEDEDEPRDQDQDRTEDNV